MTNERLKDSRSAGPLTEERLAQISDSLAKITPGPWHIGHVNERNDNLVDIDGYDGSEVCETRNLRDQAFIANAPTYVNELLEEVKSLRVDLAIAELSSSNDTDANMELFEENVKRANENSDLKYDNRKLKEENARLREAVKAAISVAKVMNWHDNLRIYEEALGGSEK